MPFGWLARLGVRAVERLLGLLDRGVEAERLVDEVDVVVDRLGHADDGDLQRRGALASRPDPVRAP